MANLAELMQRAMDYEEDHEPAYRQVSIHGETDRIPDTFGFDPDADVTAALVLALEELR